MRRHARHASQRGFSLVEVLVSLIIIAVGMLGLAKLQALTYSDTGVSAMRSIAAIEASSLAATMHTNRTYWSGVTNGWTYSFAGNTAAATSSDMAALTTSMTSCNTPGTTCIASAIAAQDLAVWRNAVITALPFPTGTVTCSNVAPNPVTCTIQLQWIESNLSANSNSNGNAMVGAATTPYTLYVVP